MIYYNTCSLDCKKLNNPFDFQLQPHPNAYWKIPLLNPPQNPHCYTGADDHTKRNLHPPPMGYEILVGHVAV